MTAGELLNILLPRLSKEPSADTFIGALNNAILVVTRRLLYRKSSVLKEEYSTTFGANTASATLPEGYLGFCLDAPPSVSGKPLCPLPPFKYGTYSETGTPEYYDIRGGKMNLYPTPAEAVVVKALFFYRPVRLTSMSDDLPWYGLLDDLLGEAIAVIAKTGQWGAITAEWEALVNREVDKHVTAYSNRIAVLPDVSVLAR